MPTAHVVVLVSALLGWSDITIQPSRGDRGFSSFQRSLAGIDRPSERTLETLKRYDLERSYRRQRNVNNALLSLEKIARKQPDAELVYALAELSWVDGLKQDRWRRPRRSTGSWMRSAMHTITCSTPSWPTAGDRPTRGFAWPARSTTRAWNG